MKACGECFDGKVIDEKHPDYDRLDRELIRLVDGGQFSYYEAFKRATRLYPAVTECQDCGGSGRIGD